MTGTAATQATETTAEQQTSPANDPKIDPKPSEQVKAAEAVKQEIRRLKLKIDGQEQEFDEAEVIRRAQKASAAEKRFEEAATMRRQALELIEAIKSDPRSVLSNPNIGVDIKKLAKEIVWEEIQEGMLTPEQRRIAELEAREAQRQKEQEQQKAEKAQQEMQALHQKYASEYDRTITQALQASGLPKTPATVRRMTDYLFHSVKNGYDLDPADLVAQVRSDYGREHKELYGSLTAEQLLEILGEDVIKKLREADLRRLKTTTGKVVAEQKGNGSSPTAKAPKKLRGVDWRADLLREVAGK